MNQNRFPAPAGWKGREHWVGVCGLFITLQLLVNDFYCSANGTPSSRAGGIHTELCSGEVISGQDESLACQHSTFLSRRTSKAQGPPQLSQPPSTRVPQDSTAGPQGGHPLYVLQTSASLKPVEKGRQCTFQALRSPDPSSASNMALKYLPWPHCLGIKVHLVASTTTLNPHTRGHQSVLQTSHALCSQPVAFSAWTNLEVCTCWLPFLQCFFLLLCLTCPCYSPQPFQIPLPL